MAKQVQACGNFQGPFLHQAKGEAILKQPAAAAAAAAGNPTQQRRTVNAAHILHLHKLPCTYFAYALEKLSLWSCTVLNRYM